MNKKNSIRFTYFATITAMSALLVACGGGGSDSSAGSMSSIDKYIGTLTGTGSCIAEAGVTDSDTGAQLYVKTTIKSLSKSSDSKMMVAYSHAIHTASDCSGDAKAVLDTQGADSWVSLGSTAAVAGGTADKVMLSEGNKLPGISAGSISINGVTYGNAYIAAATTKDLFLLDGSSVYRGDTSKPLDASGYPTVMQAAAGFTLTASEASTAWPSSTIER